MDKMDSENKTALVLGGTGLVGSELVKLLTENDHFDTVRLIGRRRSSFNHPKIVESIIDFENPETYSDLNGDVLFAAFGTTLKKAGSKENQYRIDYTFQYEIAKQALENGVKQIVLISAAGAKVNSPVFYSRIKGELDRDIKKLPFTRINILKPSMLDGDRIEKRVAEKLGLPVARILKFIPGLKKYRPIHAKIVAQAMINCCLYPQTKSEFITDEIFRLAADIFE